MEAHHHQCCVADGDPQLGLYKPLTTKLGRGPRAVGCWAAGHGAGRGLRAAGLLLAKPMRY